jgi:hypothetical protein
VGCAPDTSLRQQETDGTLPRLRSLALFFVNLAEGQSGAVRPSVTVLTIPSRGAEPLSGVPCRVGHTRTPNEFPFAPTEESLPKRCRTHCRANLDNITESHTFARFRRIIRLRAPPSSGARPKASQPARASGCHGMSHFRAISPVRKARRAGNECQLSFFQEGGRKARD